MPKTPEERARHHLTQMMACPPLMSEAERATFVAEARAASAAEARARPAAAADADPIKQALVAGGGCDFDKLGGENMQEVDVLEGKCRGFGAISFTEAESEFTIGIYTEAGEYYNILVDGRVQCHIPMFFIAGKPYHLPIVECHTMFDGLPVIDPATGNMRSREEVREIVERRQS